MLMSAEASSRPADTAAASRDSDGIPEAIPNLEKVTCGSQKIFEPQEIFSQNISAGARGPCLRPDCVSGALCAVVAELRLVRLRLATKHQELINVLCQVSPLLSSRQSAVGSQQTNDGLLPANCQTADIDSANLCSKLLSNVR